MRIGYKNKHLPAKGKLSFNVFLAAIGELMHESATPVEACRIWNCSVRRDSYGQWDEFPQEQMREDLCQGAAFSP